MDRTVTIQKIGASFVAAAAAGDWDGLEAAARTLGPQLAVLAAHGPWNSTERAALVQLRVAHQHAAQACGQALGDLATRLDDMCNNKDGWIAYALESETESAGSLA